MDSVAVWVRMSRATGTTVAHRGSALNGAQLPLVDEDTRPVRTWLPVIAACTVTEKVMVTGLLAGTDPDQTNDGAV